MKLETLSLHTITTKPWSTEECIEHYAAAGVGGITFWRYSFEGRDPAAVGRQAREAGLQVVSVARGGFFPAHDAVARQAAIDENKRAIDETAAAGAASLVLVCGAVPGMPLAEARAQIRAGVAACLDHASAAGVVLAIEPLHPMYAAKRSAINTMAQANDLCESLGDHPAIGIACDVYHTWWDGDLEAQIARAGRGGNLAAFHICDWLTPTADLLNDRGLMGEGCIDLDTISAWVAGTGFSGHHEVEIFSERWWARDQHQFLAAIINSFESIKSPASH